MYNAKLIDAADNVVVAVYEVEKHACVSYAGADGIWGQVTARDRIPIFHKIARQDIREGEPIIKYGQPIGNAACDIQAGEHVHTHNVKNRQQEERK